MHLTVMAYLSSAGRALPVAADTASVVAGWDPGSTIWLTDVVAESDGPRQDWRLGGADGTWIREL